MWANGMSVEVGSGLSRTKLHDLGMPRKRLLELYTSMLRIRLFEERVADLVEAGEIRTPTHLCIGQEAVAVGVCAQLRHEDYVWGNHRSHGHYLAKGGEARALMAEIYGKATGCARGRGGSMHVIAPEIGLLGTVPMVGATIPIAVGAGMSALMQGSDLVSISFFGDGATEEGLFHEALNFASLYKLPVVFVCENNLYSSHLPLHARRNQLELYRLAEPYGIPAVRVDGNDVLVVDEAAREAIARARSGAGPTFLECMTYRWRGHVGPKWDLDVGIRERDELEAWMRRCPIERLEAELIERALVDEQDLRRMRSEVEGGIEETVRFARESPSPHGSEMSQHVYAERE